jgi:hypothetical protein
MKLALAFLIALLLNGVASAQLPHQVFATAQQIRLLESTRQDVRKLFAGYESDLDDEESDTFKTAGTTVEVSYASGECSDEPDSNDSTEVWSVKKGKVAKVEIRFDYPVGLAEFTLDTFYLTKEIRMEDEPGSYVQFSKTRGIMFDIDDGSVERIFLYPPAAKSKSLCRENTWGKGFYASSGWFDEFQLDRVCILRNFPANVDDLELSITQIDALSNKAISISTTATDPENDVLTYKYTVSGGRIVGTGYEVVWDLTGVPPGTYSITAGVNDGAGVVGRTVSKTVTVR